MILIVLLVLTDEQKHKGLMLLSNLGITLNIPQTQSLRNMVEDNRYARC